MQGMARGRVFLALLMTSTLADANDAVPPPALGGVAAETIVVSAARVPVPLSAAGSSVSIITREEINRRNPRFLSDLLREIPGLAVSRNGGPGAQTQVRVRGAEGNHLLVLIDGVEANDFSQNDEFDFAHLTVSDIERVEVVRGPQSSLWGSDALAGVINIITRDTRAPGSLEATVESGAFGTERGALTGGGRHGAWHGRAGLSYFDTGGINVAREGAEEDGYRNAAANFRLGWDATQDLAFRMHGRLVDAEASFDGVDSDTGLRTDIDATTDITQAYVGGRADLSTFAGAWRHALIAGWTKLDNGTRDPTDVGRRRTEGRKYSLDYQSTFLVSTAWLVAASHLLTLAVDYDMEEFSQRGPVAFGLDPNQDRRRHTMGYVVDYRLGLPAESLIAITGRWDDNSNVPDVGTWRAALAHTLAPTGTVLSAAYATGQKAPTFTERYGYFSGGFLPFIGNPSLRPEHSAGWEAGLRQSSPGGRLSVGATYFNEHLFDEIDGLIFDFARGISTAGNLSGSSKRSGVELTGSAALNPRWGVNVTWTWLDATEIRGGRRVDEVRRPRHQGALGTHWRDVTGRWGIEGYVSFTGDRPDLTFLPPSFDGRVTLEAYTLAGFSASWQATPRVAVTARVENAFDDDYEEVFDFQTEGVSGYLGLRFALTP